MSKNRNVYQMLAHSASSYPDKEALILNNESISYAELATQVDKVAAWLYNAGIQQGDRVGIHLPKSAEEVVATLAITRIGAVFVNINYQWTPAQADFVGRDSGIRILFTHSRKARKLAKYEIWDQLEFIVQQGSGDAEKVLSWDHLKTDNNDLPDCPAQTHDLAALLYTSGSTGDPKGVMFSHHNIVLGAESVSSYLKNVSEDRLLSLLPFSFDYGLNQLMCMLLVGGTVVLQPVVLVKEIADTLIKQQITGVAMVPPSWVELTSYLNTHPTEFPTLRYVTNSGGKIPPKTLEKMIEHFSGAEIFLMYGLTEAFRSTFLPPDDLAKKLGSIGKAIPNAEIFVVDEEHGICGPDQPGELIHRGELISLGYWNQPEATADKICANRHLEPLIGEEKVLHSGDLVHWDEDGFLWFISRNDAMIKSSGFRISPTEVEDIVSQHENVLEALAFGIENESLGQHVHVAIAHQTSSSPDELGDKLGKFCRRQMPHYMVPKQFHFWPNELPRTANGKIDRKTIIEHCR